jgi:prepilin-type N-terminal cleavage/methylation domain-containing protein/prepilin-type processing-associated H-X9-DG protein
MPNAGLRRSIRTGTRRDRRNRTPAGFTLMEMLVVIAIIVILIAIILPALGVAKRAGRSAQCETRLRGWGAAMKSFTFSHNGHFPVTNYPLWEQSAVYAEVQNQSTMLGCPEFAPGSWTYGYTDMIGHWNYTGSEGDDAPYTWGLKWSAIKRDNITPLLSDAWNYRVTWPGEWEYAWFGPDFIHAGRNNTLLVDGHVDSLVQSDYNALRFTWVTSP